MLLNIYKYNIIIIQNFEINCVSIIQNVDYNMMKYL